MKYKLHGIKSNHIFCDILDDAGKLILGNHMHCVSSTPVDMDLFFEERIFPEIAAMLTLAIEPETKSIEASPILQAMEDTKESIKFDLIAYIKANPTVELAAFLSYCDQAFGWQNSGYALKMIYEYVREAEKKKMVDLTGSTKEYYFAVLKMIILNSTDDELKERLK